MLRVGLSPDGDITFQHKVSVKSACVVGRGPSEEAGQKMREHF